MKALVLCAGLGTRLRPFTFSTAKHLIPVANKPVLFHVVEALRDVGIEDIGVVVSEASAAAIGGALGDGTDLSVRVRYIAQESPRGLAHAVACAREFVGADDFLLYLGDTLLPEGLRGLLQAFDGADAALMLKPVDDPRSFGIVVVEDGRVKQLIEKPREPPGNLAIAGAYALRAEVFEVIEGLQPSWRGEYEITDAIQGLVDRGRDVRAFISPGWWKDTGKPEDLLEANALLLDQLVPRVGGEVDARSRLDGAVVIEAGAQVRNSRISGSVIIGEGAEVEDAEIGPHVSVGPRCKLKRCTVRESLLMSEVIVEDVGKPLVGCVIGSRCEVRGDGAAFAFVVGDDSRLRL